MAGRGSRFVEKGYALPKPLIEIHGSPMIQTVINNLKTSVPHRFIFLALSEHLNQFNLASRLCQWAPDCRIIEVKEVTQGAACTCLLAKDMINNSAPLMIANADQWVDIQIDDYLRVMGAQDLDGLIMTMNAHDTKWSYIAFHPDGTIKGVKEKEIVSNEATVGIYNFRRGSDFVSAAETMITRNIRTNNEFYVAPVYDQLLEQGKKIGFYNIGRDQDKMFGLGTPKDLDAFLQSPVSRKVLAFK